MTEEKISSYEASGGKDSYEWCLEQAGASVIAFNSFGSYQGDWIAKVQYKGEIFWIKDYYGSCSGCDSFEAESGWEDRTLTEWKAWCSNFAKDYLEDKKTYDEVLASVRENLDWDYDAKEMVEFIEKNKDTVAPSQGE